MVTEAGKELLRNTINTAKFHNRILEENEMWKQWELECGLTMMVSDDDIIKRIKKNHQCSKHRKRDKSRSRDSSRSKYEMAKIRHSAGSSNDRWDHSGFAELYPDAAVSDKYPSTSFSTLEKHKKKKKKSRHRSDSSDEEIWEEFKRPVLFWNKERTLRLIELLRDAPALWNVNYPGYKDPHVKLKERKRIASKFRIDENEIIAKIDLLISEFYEKHEKLMLQKLKGTSAKFAENEWFAYKNMTFLIKNKRNCKTVKNLRKGEIQQWDSSDSYSDSENETDQPAANQSSYCIKSKEQNEKRDAYGKKANYTCINLSPRNCNDDETSRASANRLSHSSIKVQDERRNGHEKKANYTCINVSSGSDSEAETSRLSVNQSSSCVKRQAPDEKREVVHGKETCTNLPSYCNSKDETSRASANHWSCSSIKVQDERSNGREKNDNYIGTDLPYIQAYLARKDSYSVYGEIVAHRMRRAEKNSKAVRRAENEIDTILRNLEDGFYDSSDTFK